MAVALPFQTQSIQFPRNILQESNKMTTTLDQPNNKPSLPSISSLIEAVKDQPQPGSDRSPTYEHQRKLSGASSGHPASPDRPGLMGSPRSHPPPTPPLPGPSSFDFPRHSPPGNPSPSSAAPVQANYYGHSAGTTNPENYAQRSAYPPIPEANPWPQAHESSPTDSRAPETDRTPTSAGPDQPSEASQYGGLAQQRPLPANFPPSVQNQTLPPIDPQMTPTWQHHHYYPPANPPAYPPPSERYVCPTCQKPFSRPSSLKIHTYSHTGEKPFKCKHEGCGKYFSVRSNMKRHEKGCHGGDSGSNGGSSPKA